MTIVIKKKSKARFELHHEGVPNSTLEIDFNSVINELELTGDFILLHWQARPRGLRQWGVYFSTTDMYHSFLFYKIPKEYEWKGMQIEEKPGQLPPTAVLVGRRKK